MKKPFKISSLIKIVLFLVIVLYALPGRYIDSKYGPVIALLMVVVMVWMAVDGVRAAREIIRNAKSRKTGEVASRQPPRSE